MVNNIAAEKVFLAGIVHHPAKLFEFVQYLCEDDFQHAATRMTFDAIRSLVVDKESEKISKSKIVSEAKALGYHNYLSTTKNGEWIDELFAEDITVDEVSVQFMEVKRQSYIRGVIDSLDTNKQYLKSTGDPLSEIITRVEDSVVSQVNIVDRGEHATIDMRDGFREFIDSIADDPGHMGLDLGYPIWQERAGHIRNGSITFMVGTTGSGKSQFGLRAIERAARQGLPVLYLDSELNKHDQWIRLAAMMTKVPSQYIETGFWRMSTSELQQHGVTDPKTIEEIQMYGRRLRDDLVWERMSRMPIYYQSISGLDVQEVLPSIRRWLLTHVKPDRETRVPQCLIVYDYIKLAMTNEIRSGAIQEYQQHGLNVAALHDFMNKYNVPCLAFGQTNNEVDDSLKCVAGSKRISENVESVSYLKRKTDRERAADGIGTHLMRIFKARYGMGLWDGHINFDADLSCGDFQEIALGNLQSNNESDDDNSEE
jgi:replicative DNA helicase